jgi:Mg2+ and Co2+ transporter CorA
MNYFDLLTDDIIIKILDEICDEIEVEIEEIEHIVDCIKSDYEDEQEDLWWKNKQSLEWRYHPDNGDPYDTDELEQLYELENQLLQNEYYLNNIRIN